MHSLDVQCRLGYRAIRRSLRIQIHAKSNDTTLIQIPSQNPPNILPTVS